VFGLNDGLVTTLVFIMAASNVANGHAALLLVALSEVTAGGVSMCLGSYLSARTERDILEYRIATERHEIATEPEEERTELRSIYRRKGMSGRLLENVVAHQTATHERWLQALVHDELGVVEEPTAPWRQGLSIGASSR
jgi:vacuolar iron transporter family protein